jgi:hypothetical protein
MSKAKKLLQRAKSSPKNLAFEDLCALAEYYGWVFQRQSGSHRIYMHPGLGKRLGSMMNFQPRDGKAKPFQVIQLLNAIEVLVHGE